LRISLFIFAVVYLLLSWNLLINYIAQKEDEEEEEGEGDGEEASEKEAVAETTTEAESKPEGEGDNSHRNLLQLLPSVTIFSSSPILIL
jgi:hypothetical protein